MFSVQKKLFDINIHYNHPWQIIMNQHGFLISFRDSNDLALVKNSEFDHALNLTLGNLLWIPPSFEDDYVDFIQQYLEPQNNCWLGGMFENDQLLYEADRLSLMQTRSFVAEEIHSDCFHELSRLDIYPKVETNLTDVLVSLVPGRGFHRKFKITKNSNQEIGIIFILSKDVFIDPFDPNLSFLKQYGSFKFYGEIDLEAAAYDDNAKLFLLEIILKGNATFSEFELPFHLR
jgi:hypothetical protein